MDFEKNMPNWQNKGDEPSNELKATGFKVGNKPPANIFNWFWSLTSDAITEIQQKLKLEESNRITKENELQENKSNLDHRHKKEDIIDFPTTMKADGGNADTVDGKHATDFASFKHFDSISTMRESQYEGGFSLSGDYGPISGYSFYGDKKQDIRPDNVVYLDCYMRFYCDNDTWYLATDYYNDDDGKWTHNDVKRLEFQGHKHKKEDITDFPTALPANGGNADTVDNKHASDFATASHTHSDYVSKNDTIAIAKGGTGATTASGARANLELGNSATRNCTTAVTSGSTNLVTSGAVYTELQKYLKSDGDGSDVTNVNAVTVGGKSISDLLVKTNQVLWVENTDFNTITGMGVYTIGTGDGTEMSDSKNQPVGAYPWGILAVFASESYALTQVYYTHTGDTYIRGLYGGDNWNSWKKCGENANSVNKIAKNFTVKKGSWFKFAKCKKALASGVFVLEVGSNNSCSSISTFSVSQAYSAVNTGQTKITELSHSSFNSCVTKVRLDTNSGDGVEQYIDFYIENGSDNSTGYAIIQFFGQGWEVCDIESNNALTGYTTKELIL